MCLKRRQWYSADVIEVSYVVRAPITYYQGHGMVIFAPCELKFQGMMNSCSGCLIESTGQGAFLTTFSATLPKRICDRPDFP